jgi:hypothetical protein
VLDICNVRAGETVVVQSVGKRTRLSRLDYRALGGNHQVGGKARPVLKGQLGRSWEVLALFCSQEFSGCNGVLVLEESCATCWESHYSEGYTEERTERLEKKCSEDTLGESEERRGR